MQPILTIIIPAFNEEQVLPATFTRLEEIELAMKKNSLINPSSGILVVDDGSTDKTWQLIYEEHQREPLVNGIKFSRNFGHQQALIAGLSEAVWYSDVTVTIDADLQDDPRYQFPVSAWISMGLNTQSRGTYSTSDADQLVYVHNYKRRELVANQRLEKRIHKLGCERHPQAIRHQNWNSSQRSQYCSMV